MRKPAAKRPKAKATSVPRKKPACQVEKPPVETKPDSQNESKQEEAEEEEQEVDDEVVPEEEDCSAIVCN